MLDFPLAMLRSNKVFRRAAAQSETLFPMNHVFVYGTLKQGFGNFGVNAGRRVPGVFRTVQRFPLYIIGEHFLPWLVNQPGSGEHVLGQVFQVDEEVLRGMDALEQIDEAGWYARVEIDVEEVGAPNQSPQLPQPPQRVFVYFGASERVPVEHVHAGPLVEFTAEHNVGYLHAASKKHLTN